MKNKMKNLAEYNSPETIGTTHWFRTLVSKSQHIGEFMKNHSSILKSNSELIEDYGKQIQAIAKDLIEWQENNKELFESND